MQIDLHEMSNPVFLGKNKKKKIISLSPAEFAQGVANDKHVREEKYLYKYLGNYVSWL